MLARAQHAGLYVVAFAALSAACFERPQTRFPHELHLTRLPCGGPSEPECLDCTSCHAASASAVAISEPRGLPDVQQCSGCHLRDAEEKLLGSMRHTGPAPAHDIQFAHSRHLNMPAIHGQCIGCHAGAIDDARLLFPPMAQCFECHEHQDQFDAGACGPCHESRDLRELLPQSFMQHDSEWLRHHGAEASQREQVCTSCHGQTECNDCHDTTQALARELRMPESMRELVHPADFLTRHALEAASQPARCLTCHEPATCDGCHVERGVSAFNSDALSPHPPGWIGGNPSSRNFHGRAARRDLLACAACHDQGPATNCIGCHRVGGYGGNPHPGGWQSSRSETSSMCRYCHVQ